MKRIIERLSIENFFSIINFDWEIKDFNVLTGGMASGKSLCIKLVQFLEQISKRIIFFSVISRDTLVKEIFYNNISKHFHSLFPTNNLKKDFYNTKITYTFEVLENHRIFDLNAQWNDQENKLEWHSNYINENINKWRDYLDEQRTPDTVRFARKQISEKIADDFLNHFPVDTMFIPASRAIASIITNTETNIPDKFLSAFINYDKPLILDLNDVSESETNNILHLNNIIVKEDPITKEKTFAFESILGKDITPLELSSGQQELLLLLLLIKVLPNIGFHSNIISVFIEEPCAHLFPKEQKDTVEYFAKIFRMLKDEGSRNVRFFITTHSPYILNVVNNMLKKGSIISRNEDKKEEIINNKEIDFPHLFAHELTASFIKDDGKIDDMLDEEMIIADKIAAISYMINNDTINLNNLNNELLYSKEN